MPMSLWNLYALCYDAITAIVPYQEMLEDVVVALELAPGMRVLDAGCGTGVLAERMAQACPGVELVAVDLSRSMLARARGRRGWPASFSFVESGIDDVLQADLSGFDRIASVNVIWTLPDPERTLARMQTRLRPGGRMVHTTPRGRFGAHAILWRHLRGSWRKGFARALLGLPLLGLAALLNLVLVAQSVLKARAPLDRRRWNAAGLSDLCQAAGATPAPVRPCYAGQGNLVVCDKVRHAADSEAPQLPGRGQRL